MTRSRPEMTAAIAESDEYDVLVDVDGSIWVRRNALWTYLTDDGPSRWDSYDRLPTQYEPYIQLDPASAAFILRNLTS